MKKLKKIVYIFDNVNYQSGAQKASFYQMQCLSKKYDIYLMSLSKPEKNMNVPGTIIQLEALWEKAELYTKSLREILNSEKSLLKKMGRVFYSILTRLGIGEWFLGLFLYGELAEKLEKFDVVIVVSEASKMRSLVAGLKNPKKIQWIHTDYEHWCQYSEWTKSVTKNDYSLYKKFDYIIVLSESCRQGTIRRLPELVDKIIVIPNLINVEDIQKKSLKRTETLISNKTYNFITVGRLDKEKNYDGILDICKHLSDDKIDYSWYFIGDGTLRHSIEVKIKMLGLQDHVILLGRLENPYPVMRQCDIFVLLSDYEGTPITIDEAASLGLYIVATPVGGIPEQLERYGYGRLLKEKENLYIDFKLALSERNKITKKSFDLMNQEVITKIAHIIEKENIR